MAEFLAQGLGAVPDFFIIVESRRCGLADQLVCSIPEHALGSLVEGQDGAVDILYRTMSPRVAILGRHHDGTLRDAKVNNLPVSEHVILMRFDGSLYFANVSYFEDTILEEVAKHPMARYLLVVGDGINQLDSSGEEVIRHLVERLRSNGITMVFSGLKKQVLDVMRKTGLMDLIGAQNVLATANMALEMIGNMIGENEPYPIADCA